MPLGFVFWFVMLFWALSYWYGSWGPGAGSPHWPRAHWGLLFVLMFILGWAVFGFAIRG